MRGMFKRDPSGNIEQAEQAMSQGAWPEAAKQWEAIIKKFKSQTPAGVYVRLAIAYRKQAKLDEAEQVVTRGLKKHPAYMPMSLEYAEIAFDRKDWAEAATRWQAVLDRFPETAPVTVWVRLARSYRFQNDLAQAKKLVEQALSTYVNDAGLCTEAAYIAAAQENWAEALASWQAIMTAQKDQAPAEAWAGLAQAQRKSGDLTQAEATIKKGFHKHPSHLGLNLEYAELTTDQKNWAEAATRWQAVLDRFGTSPALTIYLQQTARFTLSIVKRLQNPAAYKKKITMHANSKKGFRKIAIVTAASQGYDSLKPHAVIDDRFDYIAYTDDLGLVDSGLYGIRPLPQTWPDAGPLSNKTLDSPRAIRIIKTHPHTLFDQYDLVIWLDTSIMIVGDIYPILEKFMKTGQAIGAGVHPNRSSIFEELEACIAMKKDNPDDLKRQLAFYKKIRLGDLGLAECGFLAFNLKDRRADVAAAMDTWWDQICRFSRRDQLSFPYALSSNKVTWHPVTQPPQDIRHHPDFVITPHQFNPAVLQELNHLLTSNLKQAHFLGPIRSASASEDPRSEVKAPYWGEK